MENLFNPKPNKKLQYQWRPDTIRKTKKENKKIKSKFEFPTLKKKITKNLVSNAEETPPPQVIYGVQDLVEHRKSPK